MKSTKIMKIIILNNEKYKNVFIYSFPHLSLFTIMQMSLLNSNVAPFMILVGIM